MWPNLKNVNFYIMVLSDLAIFALALVLSYMVRLDLSLPAPYAEQCLRLVVLVAPFKSALFFLFGMYKGMWRYTSLVDFMRLAQVTLAQSLLLVAVIALQTRFMGYPRSVFIIDWMLTLGLAAGLRVSIRAFYHWREGRPMELGQAKRVLVVGAGRAGELIYRELMSNPRLNYQLVGFVDDDPGKRGRSIHNKPVLGMVKDLAGLVREREVDEIFIAVTQASGEQMRRLIKACESTRKPYKILPSMGEIMDGRVGLKTLRDVDYLDLLGRTPIELDDTAIGAYLTGKTVLVSGCGGSIGTELCRQIVRFNPARLILVDMGEFNLYRMEMELKWELSFSNYVTVLGSVADADLMDRVFATNQPDCVFHAAAYKHVPMLERNPWQAVTNNVRGTLTLMRAAMAHQVGRFVIVSTDKAVRPTNVMGASKRVTERLMACHSGGPTRFMAVRFGNVLGSSGSVAPLFRRQIERGGPVTVTHPEVTRYFMSISEAAQLILQAGAMARGGEIFVLDMGVPVRIADMAADLIRLSGKEPGKDIEIVFTGLREGEKLYEELITDGEDVVRTEHERIRVLGATDPMKDACELNGEGLFQGLPKGLEELFQAALDRDPQAIRVLLKRLVPEYVPEPRPDS